MKINSQKELEDYLEKGVIFAKGLRRVRIEYKGRAFRAQSGKMMWNTVGAAKNALRYNIHGKDYLKMIREMEENGDINYIIEI